jgi:hypothetical protein
VTISPAVQIPILAALATLVGVLLWALMRRGLSTEEIERRRLTAIYANGKLGDGEVIDVEGIAIVYSYSVGGVGYTASQDVTIFEARLPKNTMAMVGPALVKFDPRNPANSIVICEEWSGLGGQRRS